MAKVLGKKKTVKKVRRKKAAAPKAEAVLRRSLTPVTLVRRALRGIAHRIETDDMKASIGDLIRLLQLKQEIEAEQPKEIKVTWMEPGEKSVSEE
jgi:hypothetical protein